MDPRSRVLSPADLASIASRLNAAARGFKYRPKLQTDLVLASRLISMLLRTRVINAPVDLEADHG
jgi:hypothetical protein